MLVVGMMVLNVIALLFVPWLVTSADELHLFLEERVLHLLRIQPYGEDDIVIPIIFVALAGWGEVWQDTVCALYTLFLLICGVCCFVILKQAKGILNTVLEGAPFQMANAHSMRRAAVCCWIITGIDVYKRQERPRSILPQSCSPTTSTPIFCPRRRETEGSRGAMPCLLYTSRCV